MIKRLFLIEHDLSPDAIVAPGDRVMRVYPTDCMDTLSMLRARHEDERFDVVTGVGMAGYFALKLAESHDVRCVVMNPVVDPSLRMLRFIATGYPDDTGKRMSLDENAYNQFMDVRPDLLERRAENVFVITHQTERWGRQAHIPAYFDSIGIPIISYSKFVGTCCGLTRDDLRLY